MAGPRSGADHPVGHQTARPGRRCRPEGDKTGRSTNGPSILEDERMADVASLTFRHCWRNPGRVDRGFAVSATYTRAPGAATRRAELETLGATPLGFKTGSAGSPISNVLSGFGGGGDPVQSASGAGASGHQ